MVKYFVVLVGVLLILTGNSSSFAAFSSDFATADECAFCHTSDSFALVDSEGNDLSIADDWSSTMMGNSFKDPFFRAKLESEIVRNPQLAAAIEDKCLTCHTPMARTQAVRDGARNYPLSDAENSLFAADGVSCTLCHQIQDDDLGKEQSYSGKYQINGDRNIFGPYKQVFANPMINHVNYLPVYGAQVDKPELCATCHTLFTPFVDGEGKIAGEFPEQTPYLEWLNSIYSSSENYQSCQDCHMPRIDEPVKITNRPPWYRVRQSPFWAHHFTGGNKFILEMMKENSKRLGIFTSKAQFNKSIERTTEQLSSNSAEVIIAQVEQDNNRLRADVSVINKTGHKFPTGFPSRRIWIHFAVVDSLDRVVFESGKTTSEGEILGLNEPYEKHHDIINTAEQIQIYQAIMGDVAGKQTDTLLKAASYLKDNRLPPKGFQRSGAKAEFTRPAGMAATDENFNVSNNQEGSGTDHVTYEIDVTGALFPLTIKAQLLYQSSSPRFLENLFNDETPAVLRFRQMYAQSSKTPMVVDASVLDWNSAD